MDYTTDELLYLSKMDNGIPAAQSREEAMATNTMNEGMTSAAVERPHRHVSFPPFGELPHKDTTTSSPSPEGSILRGRPTHQGQSGSSRIRTPSIRPPSPYPGQRLRKISFACLPEISEMSHREVASSSSPSPEGPSSILRGRPTHQTHGSGSRSRARAPSPYPGQRRLIISFDQSAELPHRQKVPSPKPTPPSNLRERPTHQSHRSGDRRSRSPSPYPGMKRPRVTFPPFWEMPIKTGLPNLDLPSSQKQFKKGGAREGSSRSRPGSPHPSSRAHRKEILLEMEASRTGHRDGRYHQATRMSGPPYAMLGLMDVDHGKATNQAIWPSVSTLSGRDIFIAPDVSPSTNNTTSAIETVLKEKQQDQEESEDKSQDEGEFWDAFEDFNVPQVPQGYYDPEEVESTEPRREGGGWFSRWFSSGR